MLTREDWGAKPLPTLAHGGQQGGPSTGGALRRCQTRSERAEEIKSTDKRPLGPIKITEGPGKKQRGDNEPPLTLPGDNELPLTLPGDNELPLTLPGDNELPLNSAWLLLLYCQLPISNYTKLTN